MLQLVTTGNKIHAILSSSVVLSVYELCADISVDFTQITMSSTLFITVSITFKGDDYDIWHQRWKPSFSLQGLNQQLLLTNPVIHLHSLRQTPPVLKPGRTMRLLSKPGRRLTPRLLAIFASVFLPASAFFPRITATQLRSFGNI